jgi:sulfonate transport system substrate-binding protein
MKKVFGVLLIIGIFTTLMTGISRAEDKPQVIRIGCTGSNRPIPGNILGIVNQLGLLEQEFKKDGIQIEWNVFKGAGPASNEALANGTVDFVTFGDFPSIMGKAGGLKHKAIAINDVRRSSYIIIQPDSKIKSVADLRGKKVGIGKGGFGQLFFSRLLALHGVNPKDVREVNLQGGDSTAAFLAKEVEAIVTGSDGIDLRNRGLGKILVSTKNSPEFLKATAALVVTEQFAKKYPEVTYRFVKTFIRGAKIASEEKNRGKTFALWGKSGNSLQSLKENYDGIPLKLVTNPVFDDFTIDHYKQSVKFLKDNNIIRKAYDVDQWIDRSYQDRALKELKLEKFWPASDVEGKPHPR